MRCDFCQGQHYVHNLPCLGCGGMGVVSCCEGSERYGQLEVVREIMAKRRDALRELAKS
jgi:hypothetical protein